MPVDRKAARGDSHGHCSGGKQKQYRVLTLREFKEEIEETMLNLLVMPRKKNATLAPFNSAEKKSEPGPFNLAPLTNTQFASAAR